VVGYTKDTGVQSKNINLQDTVKTAEDPVILRTPSKVDFDTAKPKGSEKMIQQKILVDQLDQEQLQGSMSKDFMTTPFKDSSTLPAVSKFVNTVENTEKKNMPQQPPSEVDKDL